MTALQAVARGVLAGGGKGENRGRERPPGDGGTGGRGASAAARGQPAPRTEPRVRLGSARLGISRGVGRLPSAPSEEDFSTEGAGGLSPPGRAGSGGSA